MDSVMGTVRPRVEIAAALRTRCTRELHPLDVIFRMDATAMMVVPCSDQTEGVLAARGLRRRLSPSPRASPEAPRPDCNYNL